MIARLIARLVVVVAAWALAGVAGATGDTELRGEMSGRASGYAIEGAIPGIEVRAELFGAYRDFMPTLDRRATPDGGSELIVHARVAVTNHSRAVVRLSYEASIEAGGTAYRLILPGANGGTRAGIRVAPGDTADLLVATTQGPLLPPGSRFDLVTRITGPEGRTLAVRWRGVEVKRTS